MRLRIVDRLTTALASGTRPRIVTDMSNDERLVFTWGTPYLGHASVVQIHGQCLYRVKPEEPDEIPAYITGTGTDARGLIENTIIERNAVREYFRAAPSMPDPLPDPPCPIGIEDVIGIRDPDLLMCVRNAVSRNRRSRESIDSFVSDYDDGTEMSKYLLGLVDLDIKVPLHVVTDPYELGQRNLRGTVYTMYPFYTTCCTILDDDSSLSRLMANDFVSMIAASRDVLPDNMRDFPIRNTSECYTQHQSRYGTYIVIDLDLDGINDALDRDGWTPEMQQFAREQLKIDLYHKFAFTRFLRARKDTPLGIM